MLSGRTTKSEPLHKITTVAVNHHQVRNAVLRDSEAMEICIKRPKAPEICRTQVIDLRLIKAGEEGCSFMRRVKNGDRTAAHFKLRGRRRKRTYQESTRHETRNLKKKKEVRQIHREEKERNKGKDSSPRSVIMGVVGRTETGIEGTTKTNAVNTAKIDAEDTAGMGAVGAVGVAAADTLTFAASPGPSKGFANERNGHTNKRGKVNLAKKKKRRGGGEESTYP